MKFNLNDNVACGFLAGINPFDIRNYVIAAAKARGLHLHDMQECSPSMKTMTSSPPHRLPTRLTR